MHKFRWTKISEFRKKWRKGSLFWPWLSICSAQLSSVSVQLRSVSAQLVTDSLLVIDYWLVATEVTKHELCITWAESAQLSSPQVQFSQLSSVQLSSISSAQLSSLSSARSAQLSSARSAHSSTIRQYVEPAYLSWSQVCWPCHKCGTAIPKLYRIEQSCTLNQGTHKGCTNIGDPFYPGAWITILSNIWEMQYQWWLHFLCPLPLSTHNFWICVGKSFTYFCHVWGGGRAQQGPSAWEPFWRLCPPIQNPVCAHALDKALSWLKINPVKEATYYFNLTKNHVTSGIYLCTVECWNYSFKKL